jgi:hypothetical protein
MAIAQRLGLAQSTVCNDLKAIREYWRESQVRNFDDAVARELEKIDRVEREAWEAWERSKGPEECTVVTDGRGGKRAQKRVKNQHGDPRYLEQVQKCIASRRTLLGLDAPTRIAPVSPDGEEAYDSHVMGKIMELAEGCDAPRVIDAEYVQRIAQLSSPWHHSRVQLMESMKKDWPLPTTMPSRSPDSMVRLSPRRFRCESAKSLAAPEAYRKPWSTSKSIAAGVVVYSCLRTLQGLLLRWSWQIQNVKSGNRVTEMFFSTPTNSCAPPRPQSRCRSRPRITTELRGRFVAIE